MSPDSGEPKPHSKPVLASRPSPSVSIPKGSFEHVVIILKENHTFDCYFGTFPGANGIYGADARAHGFTQYNPIAKRQTHAFRVVAPQVGDRPQMWIEVDTTKPVVKLLSVVVGTGPDKGKLTVNWDAKDKNLAKEARKAAKMEDEKFEADIEQSKAKVLAASDGKKLKTDVRGAAGTGRTSGTRRSSISMRRGKYPGNLIWIPPPALRLRSG